LNNAQIDPKSEALGIWSVNDIIFGSKAKSTAKMQFTVREIS